MLESRRRHRAACRYSLMMMLWTVDIMFGLSAYVWSHSGHCRRCVDVSEWSYASPQRPFPIHEECDIRKFSDTFVIPGYSITDNNIVSQFNCWVCVVFSVTVM